MTTGITRLSEYNFVPLEHLQITHEGLVNEVGIRTAFELDDVQVHAAFRRIYNKEFALGWRSILRVDHLDIPRHTVAILNRTGRGLAVSPRTNRNRLAAL